MQKKRMRYFKTRQQQHMFTKVETMTRMVQLHSWPCQHTFAEAKSFVDPNKISSRFSIFTVLVDFLGQRYHNYQMLPHSSLKLT